MNRDGKLDLVVADNGGTTVSVLLGDGTGAFTTSDVTVGAQPAAVGLGDFNRDGKLDLVVGTATGSVSVLAGDGVGGFGGATTVASPAGATELADRRLHDRREARCRGHCAAQRRPLRRQPAGRQRRRRSDGVRRST